MPERVTALVGLRDLHEAVALVNRLDAELDSLEAADFFFADGLDLVCRHRRLARPLAGSAGVYVILECAGRDGVLEPLAAALGDEAENVVVADDTLRRAALWEYREAHNEAVAANGIPAQARRRPAAEPAGRRRAGYPRVRGRDRALRHDGGLRPPRRGEPARERPRLEPDDERSTSPCSSA
jgi:hypothetical protein